MAKILLVEDDQTLADMLTKWLSNEGHVLTHAACGDLGWDLLRTGAFDLAVLDWELPSRSGIELCKHAREDGLSVAILMLTARQGIDNTESGLQCGADDYLTKPFAAKELSARIRALLRRGGKPFTGLSLAVRDMTLKTGDNAVIREGKEITLTPNEYKLIEFLVRNPDRVFSIQELFDHVWSSSADTTDAAVTSCIKRLRQKIDKPGEKSLIKTVYGGGYRLDP